MNTLSWMIYFADVVGTIDGIGLTFAIAGGVIAPCLWIVAAIFHGDRDEQTARACMGYSRSAIASFVGGLTLMAVAPSTGTLYAIAASEMGESALNTETGGKAVKALNAWLDRQIADEGEAE